MKIKPSTQRIPILGVSGLATIGAIFLSLTLSKTTGWKLYPIAVPLSLLAVFIIIEVVITFSRRACEEMEVGDHLTLQQGIIKSEKSLIQLKAIKNIKVTQSLIQRIAGTGNLIFYTTSTSATPDDVIVFQEIADPYKVQEQIWGTLCGKFPPEPIPINMSRAVAT